VFPQKSGHKIWIFAQEKQMYKQAKDYPHEFKIQAIKRYLENGRRVNYTAKELGIPESTLRGWRDKYMDELKKEDTPSKKKKKDYETLLKEKEKIIQQLEEENLILKKSIGIFTRDPRQK
ncbi:transposase, partial [Leptospira levettii]|uniref:transposase n=2 Tax=Leptospira levettii TaxID=2023178 RepID=UPI001AEFE248